MFIITILLKEGGVADQCSFYADPDPAYRKQKSTHVESSIIIISFVFYCSYCEKIVNKLSRKQCSGSGIRCLFDPWIRDPGWVESQHPDPGSGMNNPDHIF
jgi:hypothetical protein